MLQSGQVTSMWFTSRLIMLALLVGSLRANYFSDNIKKFLYKDAPKLWFPYLQKLLSFFEKSGNILTFGQSHVIFELKHLSKLAEKLCRKANHIVAQKHETPTKNKNRIIASPAGGLLFDTKFSWCPAAHPCLLIFKQNKLLQIKIHFVQIYFATETGLSIWEAGHVRTLGDTNRHIYIFWGIHSSVDFHPAFRNMTIQIFAGECFHIELTYVVIDAQTIENLFHAPSYQAEKIDEELTFFLLNNKTGFNVHEMRSEKYKTIIIEVEIFSINILEIRDGPGALSNLLYPEVHSDKYVTYRTSSFQSTIFKTEGSYNVLFFHTTSISGFSDIHVRPNETQFRHISNKHFLKYVHFFIVHTDKQYLVQTRIEQITQKGRHSDILSCHYAGLSLYMLHAKGIREAASLCGTEYLTESHTHNTVRCFKDTHGIRRNFYSGENDMLMVVYSFSSYVEFFETQVQFSVSNCKIIHMNTCEYQVTERYRFVNQSGNHFVQVEDSQCVVMQVEAEEIKSNDLLNMLRKNQNCTLKIRPGTDELGSGVILYNITFTLQKTTGLSKKQQFNS